MTERKIPVECWTRIVGYFRPVKESHPGKREEISDRALMSKEKIEKAVGYDNLA